MGAAERLLPWTAGWDDASGRPGRGPPLAHCPSIGQAIARLA